MIMNVQGYEIDLYWEFWRTAGKLRNDMSEVGSFHHRRARAMERAAAHVAALVNAIWIDRLCEPWFDGSAFRG